MKRNAKDTTICKFCGLRRDDEWTLEHAIEAGIIVRRADQTLAEYHDTATCVAAEEPFGRCQ